MYGEVRRIDWTRLIIGGGAQSLFSLIRRNDKMSHNLIEIIIQIFNRIIEVDISGKFTKLASCYRSCSFSTSIWNFGKNVQTLTKS